MGRDFWTDKYVYDAIPTESNQEFTEIYGFQILNLKANEKP